MSRAKHLAKLTYAIHYLAEQTVAQREDDEMKGIYSDVFTAEVRASDDFGIVTV